eukprot:TRINITY_DN7736_c0_g1_i2.p1 TRINITY_DN7736_c0_g1~~TRINITY_DN7736_c0_g1_i2.p1  ORF type:complete len:382 (+),score=103.61 TRINITY_DN7736_c0_g1_i2:120-1265(+)
MCIRDRSAAGIFTGGVTMLLGVLGLVEALYYVVPHSVINGIQLGLGLRMLIKGVKYNQQLAWFGADSRCLGIVCALLSFWASRFERVPVALLMFILGVLIAIPSIDSEFDPWEATPWNAFSAPSAQEWASGIWEAGVPQLPLTMLNSVLSIVALGHRLFPDRPVQDHVSRRSVASSVGMMNVLACWFGAMPSCHGAGGLAGQYLFGSRGAAGIRILGLIKVVLSFVFGSSLLLIVQEFPLSVLGVMLGLAGIELARVGMAQQRGRSDDLACLLTAGTYIALGNAAYACVAGFCAVACQSTAAEAKEAARQAVAHLPWNVKTTEPELAQRQHDTGSEDDTLPSCCNNAGSEEDIIGTEMQQQHDKGTQDQTAPPSMGATVVL